MKPAISYEEFKTDLAHYGTQSPQKHSFFKTLWECKHLKCLLLTFINHCLHLGHCVVSNCPSESPHHQLSPFPGQQQTEDESVRRWLRIHSNCIFGYAVLGISG
ncbi:hypothetical protein CDAR_455221 [Caerostris darwini]|uniref:Uncharacterized protein n=1 Tax=Caerostris darwini TaxID=1538125 RepID=A0AAV4WVF4_9ARAC|nr:hypothetical protein CDAR_455221 [Caerostris darwini]